jgi:hypothetical protein
LDFAIRISRRNNKLDGATVDPKFSTLRSSIRFRGFIAALAIATVCIFVRSVYRVAELSEGWMGYLIKQQGLFIGLEGVMVLVAVLALNFFHPAFCLMEGIDDLGGIGSLWGSKSRHHQEEAKSRANTLS